MRAEIYRPDDPATPVAIAVWSGEGSRLEPVADDLEGIHTLLRPVPVVVEGAGSGERGEILLEPGSYRWFREALVSRAGALGLQVRFVSDEIVGGWDPAAGHRAFEDEVERLASPETPR
ncbi:MAG TPA: hypothetical protein VIC58_01065 [Actinomycetota bacterium]|jgi:hypothetical protein